jgi:hypothetical protein
MDEYPENREEEPSQRTPINIGSETLPTNRLSHPQTRETNIEIHLESGQPPHPNTTRKLAPVVHHPQQHDEPTSSLPDGTSTAAIVEVTGTRRRSRQQQDSNFQDQNSNPRYQESNAIHLNSTPRLQDFNLGTTESLPIRKRDHFKRYWRNVKNVLLATNTT